MSEEVKETESEKKTVCFDAAAFGLCCGVEAVEKFSEKLQDNEKLDDDEKQARIDEWVLKKMRLRGGFKEGVFDTDFYKLRKHLFGGLCAELKKQKKLVEPESVEKKVKKEKGD